VPILRSGNFQKTAPNEKKILFIWDHHLGITAHPGLPKGATDCTKLQTLACDLITFLKWLNTPERNCILPEVLVKTALISIWTKLFVPISFFTDSLFGIYTCSSPGL
jgi:hypothetical protein